jgi:tRNA modification GTPase
MKTTIDTIVAQATPAGRGGVAVVRVSGPKVKAIAEVFLNKQLTPRVASYLPFLDENNLPLDQGIAIFFKAPHSFTGEDVLELHGHGGNHVVQMLIERVTALGARLARPGEFSERAFLNNKIDLVQAEAIADLIDAGSKEAARAALRSLQGQFSKKINDVLEKLIYLRTYVEASIDFVEEEIDFLQQNHITDTLQQLISDLTAIQSEATQGSLLREGQTAVILGKPNVGKSSLLNALSGKDSAIVTAIPGTTRDVIREAINIDGLRLNIVDTAGLRDTDDIIEQEGIKRALLEQQQADLIFIMFESEVEEVWPSASLNKDAKVIYIKNKIDLSKAMPKITERNGKPEVALSAKTGDGIALLKELIKKQLNFQTEQSSTFLARRRHLVALNLAQEALGKGVVQLTEFKALELLAYELHLAQNALSEITGEFSADDLLGKIFSSFCIGK